MTAEYLLRFDDICPAMNWSKWNRIERILLDQEICPVLAVVPDNRDPNLNVGTPDPRFWDRVRGWQARGWTIGMHGWQHRFVTDNSGIIGVTNRSEFAGLPLGAQQSKISAAAHTFKKEGLESTLWIAPAHSFDHLTLGVLKEYGFEYLSDGFAAWPFSDALGMVWIPQQLWSFRYRPFGTWTICFHINTWTDGDIVALESSILKYRARISTFSEIVKKYAHRRKTFWDSVTESAYRFASRSKTGFSKKFHALLGRAASGLES
jgi:predicted deacetylase